MINLYQKTNRGFSLIEMLVAVSILLLVIVGPMTITSRASKSASFATEQVQATFLAQEGFEMVQKIRDDLLLAYLNSGAGSPWGTFASTSGAYQNCFTSGCGLEWNTLGEFLTSPISCNSGACLLYYNGNASRSKYTHSAAGLGVSTTPYTRTIKLSLVGGGEAVKVLSTVSWRTGSLVASQKVEVENYLYNIYGTP